jgi:hypothetical protein
VGLFCVLWLPEKCYEAVFSIQLANLVAGDPVAALQVGKWKTAGHFQTCERVIEPSVTLVQI